MNEPKDSDSPEKEAAVETSLDDDWIPFRSGRLLRRFLDSEENETQSEQESPSDTK